MSARVLSTDIETIRKRPRMSVARTVPWVRAPCEFELAARHDPHISCSVGRSSSRDRREPCVRVVGLGARSRAASRTSVERSRRSSGDARGADRLRRVRPKPRPPTRGSPRSRAEIHQSTDEVCGSCRAANSISQGNQRKGTLRATLNRDVSRIVRNMIERTRTDTVRHSGCGAGAASITIAALL